MFPDKPIVSAPKKEFRQKKSHSFSEWDFVFIGKDYFLLITLSTASTIA